MGMLIKKKLNRTSWFSKTGLALLLTLSATVLMTDNNAFALGGVISDCSGCHGYTSASTTPIADGASRNDAGKFQGSHNPHVITQSIVCSTCHTQPSTNAHANGTVDINAAGTISGGTYPKGSFAVSNGAFSPQSCSNVTCHEPYAAGTTTTPLWGTAATCDACHKGSGALTTTGPASGSHSAHNKTDCSLCHTGATNSTTLPSANHMNNNINVANGYPATVTKHTFNAGFTGKCSTASCHGNPYGSGSVTTPVWGTTSGCEACHSAVLITATGPATGGHVLAGHQVACTTCHAAGTSATTMPSVNHADTFINVVNVGYVAGTAVAKHTSGSGYSTCNNASCHGNPYAAGTATTPTWSGTSTGCSACHSAYPITATGPATGGHVLSGHQVACTTCHAAGTSATTVPSANHGDTFINVVNVGYVAGTSVAKHAAGSGYSTCNNASCHGNPYAAGTATTPTWSGTSTGCSACHSAYPITASGPATGSHANHHNFACTECHNAGTTATSVPSTGHGNTFIDVVNVGYTANVTKHTAGTGYSTCSTLACHVGTTATTVQWGSTTLDCIACHSYTVMIHAGPLAGGTRPAVAASLKSSGTRSHKSTTVGSDATKWDCIVCHMEGDYASGGTSTLHANGVIDFRDPDTGTQIKKVQWTGVGAAGAYSDNPALTNYTTSRFTRDLSKTLENDPQWLRVASIQVNLCLKCHDTNGAASTTNVWTKNASGTVIGTANQPFGNAVGNTSTLYPITATIQNAANNTVGAVMNIKTSFDPTNASHHAVLGKGNNGFTGTATMKAPWNTATTPTAKPGKGSSTVYGWLVSCFDCHGATNAAGVQTATVVAHGNGSTSTSAMLRGVPYTSTPTAGAPNLCTVCHGDNYFAVQNHGANSAMAAGDTNGTNFMTDSRGGIGCAICHVTATANKSARSVAVHGFNVTEAGLAQHTTTNSKPYAFMRGGLKVPYWGPGTCSISGCTSSGTYTPGGVY